MAILAVRPLLPNLPAAEPVTPAPGPGLIVAIQPAEDGFFTKRLDYDGIAIKAPTVVVDEALVAARDRLQLLLTNLPAVRSNLAAARAELHLIGRDQVISDLPEWRHMKGKPFEGKLTIDERTRGMGGRLTSCGEENLLKLENDRYRGRDICEHEFAHCIYQYGVPQEIRDRFIAQYHRSLAKGLWKESYAGSNDDEFFAELTMWFFGTHGDLHMAGAKPADGPAGLKTYDPEAFALFDDFYQGRMTVLPVKPEPESH